MANNTKSKDAMMQDLDILTAITILKLDVNLDYRQYSMEKRRKNPEQFDVFQDMRFHVAPDNDNEMRVFALAHPVSPLAFYTKQGAQKSLDRHRKEWQRLFYILAMAGRNKND